MSTYFIVCIHFQQNQLSSEDLFSDSCKMKIKWQFNNLPKKLVNRNEFFLLCLPNVLNKLIWNWFLHDKYYQNSRRLAMYCSVFTKNIHTHSIIIIMMKLRELTWLIFWVLWFAIQNGESNLLFIFHIQQLHLLQVAHWFNLSHVNRVNIQTWYYHNLYADLPGFWVIYNLEWTQFSNLSLTLNLFLLLEAHNFSIIKYVFISVYLIFKNHMLMRVFSLIWN